MIAQPGDSHRIAGNLVQIAVSKCHVKIPYRPCKYFVAHCVLRLIKEATCDTTVIILGYLLYQILPDKGIHINIVGIMLPCLWMNTYLGAHRILEFLHQICNIVHLFL